MPSDALTVAVTTGLGVSVLAGILSGICYILTHGLPHTRLVLYNNINSHHRLRV